jgi:hypothetical protein
VSRTGAWGQLVWSRRGPGALGGLPKFKTGHTLADSEKWIAKPSLTTLGTSVLYLENKTSLYFLEDARGVQLDIVRNRPGSRGIGVHSLGKTAINAPSVTRCRCTRCGNSSGPAMPVRILQGTSTVVGVAGISPEQSVGHHRATNMGQLAVGLAFAPSSSVSNFWNSGCDRSGSRSVSFFMRAASL